MAFLCVALIGFTQALFVVPSNAQAEAGKQLEIRVQYEGEPSGKIRTKVIFSNSELEAMGASDRKYVNITRVGTLMKTAAHCIDLDSIILAAGIDFDSVKSLTFRTRDGYTMSFGGSDYLGAVGWYYPNLGRYSNGVDIGEGALQMEAGALDGATHDSVPSLAIVSDSIKGYEKEPSFSDMSSKTSYRFLTGQTDLSYLRYTDEDGNEAFLPTGDSDVTAWDSVKYIYGIDVVLKGSPSIGGIKLGIDSTKIKVGSSKQINIVFEDAFAKLDATDAIWTSSDESIATVDSNGVVTIKKRGTVTITASSYGRTASITLNGTKVTESKTQRKDSTTAKTTKSTKATKKAANSKGQSQKRKQNSNTGSTKKVIIAKEISIGDEITPEPEETVVMPADDSQSLGAVEPYDKGVVAGSAVAAVLACGGGAAFRIRRFHIDLGANTKVKK